MIQELSSENLNLRSEVQNQEAFSLPPGHHWYEVSFDRCSSLLAYSPIHKWEFLNKLPDNLKESILQMAHQSLIQDMIQTQCLLLEIHENPQLYPGIQVFQFKKEASISIVDGHYANYLPMFYASVAWNIVFSKVFAEDLFSLGMMMHLDTQGEIPLFLGPTIQAGLQDFFSLFPFKKSGFNYFLSQRMDTCPMCVTE